VRFKNQGLVSIEVQDNGDGISSNNYETIALKHYTSKLSTYSDLTTLQTFGFRGEALSSLCALSRFSIITCLAADAPKGTRLEFEVSGKLKSTSVVAAQKGTTVIVETLFHNLPVRRRELERNVKREWGKVMGVLGQYACIQTGIKFSVTQQPTKGKKATVFSTKGNQSTRENIANIFGAKTLSALVPLDLSLELEATGAPSQKWSSNEDGKDKKIHIVGHISRPASGEGRQTPDRQMFFVNSRPCGLPQVAKAFNEVYKSYNASQSPFVFANIELDTHSYDVNVSPDKRTILLHDQSRMLETLKTALIELFESQDYTVPISQLHAQKQPFFKQSTLSRESTIPAKDSQTATELTAAENTKRGSRSPANVEGEQLYTGRNKVDGEDARSLRSAESFGSQTSQEPSQESSYNTQDPLKRSAVTRKSENRDGGAANMISNWLSSKTDYRPDSDGQALSKADSRISENLSKSKLTLWEKQSKESKQPVITTRPDDSDGVVIRDDNIIASQSSRSSSPRTESDGAEQLIIDEELETPIPVLISPVKPSSIVLNNFPRPRLHRASPEEATITIGDSHTVVSPIGSPYPKKQKINNPSASLGNKEGEVSNSPLPSFGSRLSQRFAASGTQSSPLGGPNTVDSPTREGSDSPPRVHGFEANEGEFGKDDILDSGLDTAQDEQVDSSILSQDVGDDGDSEYIDEELKKAQEEAKVQKMIEAVEISAIQPSEQNTLRAKALLRGGGKMKDFTYNLEQTLDTCSLQILHQLHTYDEALQTHINSTPTNMENELVDTKSAEEQLSLTISKDDFAKMKIIGQFNLGFILASRVAESKNAEVSSTGDEVFIIDQHASDEKYNFERLQASTIVQSQRLVQAKTLDLTAIEEEILIENLAAIEANGFVVKVDQSGDMPIGQRCELVSLPVSRETTFSIADLEELLALLVDNPAGSIPRPSRVRKMFAMRACRGSIMIGRTLTLKQMGTVRL